ncbi:MAG: hypothetical protein ABJA66_04970 [Actinomycetota bacterium]
MKNIPTNLYSENGETIIIRPWESGGSEMPRKAQKAIEEFEISINYEIITIYFNKSTRRQEDYYYLKFKDQWHWTRDKNIRNHNQYTT